MGKWTWQSIVVNFYQWLDYSEASSCGLFVRSVSWGSCVSFLHHFTTIVVCCARSIDELWVVFLILHTEITSRRNTWYWSATQQMVATLLTRAIGISPDQQDRKDVCQQNPRTEYICDSSKSKLSSNAIRTNRQRVLPKDKHLNYIVLGWMLGPSAEFMAVFRWSLQVGVVALGKVASVKLLNELSNARLQQTTGEI